MAGDGETLGEDGGASGRGQHDALPGHSPAVVAASRILIGYARAQPNARTSLPSGTHSGCSASATTAFTSITA
jgi:hypothetical protein